MDIVISCREYSTSNYHSELIAGRSEKLESNVFARL